MRSSNTNLMKHDMRLGEEISSSGISCYLPRLFSASVNTACINCMDFPFIRMNSDIGRARHSGSDMIGPVWPRLDIIILLDTVCFWRRFCGSVMTALWLTAQRSSLIRGYNVFPSACYQFLLLLEEPGTFHAALQILLSSIAFLHLHFVYMRTVGAAAAAVLVMAFYLWHRPRYRKLLFVVGTALIIGVAVGIWLKGVVTNTVYAAADAEKLAVNDYTGKFQILKEILTFEGMKQFIQSCAGKLYYLGMVSFGLFYPAV